MNPPNPPNATHKTIAIVIVSVGAVLLLMAAAQYYFTMQIDDVAEEQVGAEDDVMAVLARRTAGMEPNTTPIVVTESDFNTTWRYEDIYDDIRELAVTDYAAAADAYETVVAYSDNNDERAMAQIEAGVYNALSQDMELIKKGVNQLAEVVLLATESPRRRSDAILNVAQLVCGTGCNEDIFELVFTTEPFDSRRVGDDVGHSVAQLYEWALQLNPRANAYVRLMSWHGDQFLVKGDTISQALAERYVEKVTAYDEEALLLAPRQINSVRGTVSFNFWRGYAYGGLVYGGFDEYAGDFETSYQKAIELGQNATPGDSISEITTFAYYQYAALLHAIYAEARADDVRTLLAELIRIVDNDPDAANNQFILMVKTELTHGGQHGFVGQSIFTLGENYPEFATFINRYIPGTF